MAKAKKHSSDQLPGQVVMPGNLRFEEPQSGRGKKNTPVIIPPEVHPVTGFIEFLHEYGVLGLAIGFVAGIQAQSVMKQLLDSFINPAFQLFFGQNLSTRTFVLHFHGREAVFSWGVFVYGVLNFLFVLAAIYIIVKLFKLDKLKPKEK